MDIAQIPRNFYTVEQLDELTKGKFGINYFHVFGEKDLKNIFQETNLSNLHIYIIALNRAVNNNSLDFGLDLSDFVPLLLNIISKHTSLEIVTCALNTLTSNFQLIDDIINYDGLNIILKNLQYEDVGSTQNVLSLVSGIAQQDNESRDMVFHTPNLLKLLYDLAKNPEMGECTELILEICDCFFDFDPVPKQSTILIKILAEISQNHPIDTDSKQLILKLYAQFDNNLLQREVLQRSYVSLVIIELGEFNDQIDALILNMIHTSLASRNKQLANNLISFGILEKENLLSSANTQNRILLLKIYKILMQCSPDCLLKMKKIFIIYHIFALLNVKADIEIRREGYQIMGSFLMNMSGQIDSFKYQDLLVSKLWRGRRSSDLVIAQYCEEVMNQYRINHGEKLETIIHKIRIRRSKKREQNLKKKTKLEEIIVKQEISETQ